MPTSGWRVFSAATAMGYRIVSYADRMWAVRDPTLGSSTTARRQPALLLRSARYDEDPAGHPAGPGNAPDVVITLPDGTEVASLDPQVHARLSEVVGTVTMRTALGRSRPLV